MFDRGAIHETGMTKLYTKDGQLLYQAQADLGLLDFAGPTWTHRAVSYLGSGDFYYEWPKPLPFESAFGRTCTPVESQPSNH